MLLDFIKLPHTYNANNSSTLAKNLTKLKITPQHGCITLDVKDLYVNIPIKETVNRVNKYSERNNMDRRTIEQCTNLLEVILNNNYFLYDNKYYTNKKGVAMRLPLSGTIAEVFLQYHEQLYVKHLLEKQTITYYTRYTNDILIIFDSTKTTVNEIQKQTKNIHKNMKLKLNMESNSNIEYLDPLITRQTDQLEIHIF